MESLLDVGRTVGLASDVDDVGGCAIERLLETHEKLAGRGRSHGARHIDMCGVVVVRLEMGKFVD